MAERLRAAGIPAIRCTHALVSLRRQHSQLTLLLLLLPDCLLDSEFFPLEHSHGCFGLSSDEIECAQIVGLGLQLFATLPEILTFHAQRFKLVFVTTDGKKYIDHMQILAHERNRYGWSFRLGRQMTQVYALLDTLADRCKIAGLNRI